MAQRFGNTVRCPALHRTVLLELLTYPQRCYMPWISASMSSQAKFPLDEECMCKIRVNQGNLGFAELSFLIQSIYPSTRNFAQVILLVSHFNRLRIKI